MLFSGVVVLLASLLCASILAVPLSSLPSPHYPQSLNHPLPVPVPLARSAPPEPTPRNEDKFRSKSAQRNMLIALSTIGGSILFAFLFAIVRCTCRYKHPPKRDRIAEAIHRHNLQFEMHELARNPYALRQQDPAPPYIPRPPEYSDSLHTERSVSTACTDYPPIHSPSTNLLSNSPSSSSFPVPIP